MTVTAPEAPAALSVTQSETRAETPQADRIRHDAVNAARQRCDAGHYDRPDTVARAVACMADLPELRQPVPVVGQLRELADVGGRYRVRVDAVETYAGEPAASCVVVAVVAIYDPHAALTVGSSGRWPLRALRPLSADTAA